MTHSPDIQQRETIARIIDPALMNWTADGLKAVPPDVRNVVIDNRNRLYAKADAIILALRSNPQPGEVERLRSALHARLWVAYGVGGIVLPSGFHLGSGGEYGDYHYRWRADEGVEYVVFEGGCVWFCAVAIEGRIDTWWQAKSREDAKMSAYRDAGTKDILAALTPSESQEAGNV